MTDCFVTIARKPSAIAVLLLGMLAAWVLTPAGAISRVDLIAYRVAFEIFARGGDPYSVQELFKRQQELFIIRDHACLMWNPPIFFAYFAPLLSFPPSVAPNVARAFTVLCAWLLVLLGWRLRDPSGQNPPLFVHALCAFGLLPFWAELFLAQNSSWVTLYVASGASLFLRSRYRFIAGVLLAPAFCKPHDFFLPGLLLLWWVVTSKEIRVIAGTLTSLAVAVLVVHLVNPTVWTNWIYREEWPFLTFGANLTAVLHILGVGADPLSNLILAIVSPILGGILWCIGCQACRFTSRVDTLMWAWMVTPFFAPISFMNDHATLIFPISYFVGRVMIEFDRAARVTLLKRFLVLTAVCLPLTLIRTTPLPLFWLIYAPALPILVYATFKGRGEQRLAIGSSR